MTHQEIQDEIISQIKELHVNCPDCGDVTYDDQYTCTTCWNQGGNGSINVAEYIKENILLFKV